jgi:hypothetical protein
MTGEKKLTIFVAPQFWTALLRMVDAVNVPADELTERFGPGKFLSELLECALIDAYLERFGERVGGELAVDQSLTVPVDPGQKRLAALYMRHKRKFGKSWQGDGFFPNRGCSDPSCQLCARQLEVLGNDREQVGSQITLDPNTFSAELPG